jgi:hypothetical protein
VSRNSRWLERWAAFRRAISAAVRQEAPGAGRAAVVSRLLGAETVMVGVPSGLPEARFGAGSFASLVSRETRAGGVTVADPLSSGVVAAPGAAMDDFLHGTPTTAK